MCAALPKNAPPEAFDVYRKFAPRGTDPLTGRQATESTGATVSAGSVISGPPNSGGATVLGKTI
jgi:hypothetical protein